MVRYIRNRLLSTIGTLFILTVFIFSIIHLTPGDPARIMLGADASQEEVEALTESLGLNAPLVKQYISWVANALQGDLGISYSRNGTVVKEIKSSMGPTVTLALWAQVLTIVLAIPLGVFAARKKERCRIPPLSHFLY